MFTNCNKLPECISNIDFSTAEIDTQSSSLKKNKSFRLCATPVHFPLEAIPTIILTLTPQSEVDTFSIRRR